MIWTSGKEGNMQKSLKSSAKELIDGYGRDFLRLGGQRKSIFCPITNNRNSKRKDGNYVSKSLNGFEFCGS